MDSTDCSLIEQFDITVNSKKKELMDPKCLQKRKELNFKLSIVHTQPSVDVSVIIKVLICHVCSRK